MDAVTDRLSFTFIVIPLSQFLCPSSPTRSVLKPGSTV